MADALQREISPSDEWSVAIAAIQRYLKQACINAGIAVPSN